jgi:hypothetical protein
VHGHVKATCNAAWAPFLGPEVLPCGRDGDLIGKQMLDRSEIFPDLGVKPGQLILLCSDVSNARNELIAYVLASQTRDRPEMGSPGREEPACDFGWEERVSLHPAPFKRILSP